jgi:CubicO group peptidase (beta-lactamase class C family)
VHLRLQRQTGRGRSGRNPTAGAGRFRRQGLYSRACISPSRLAHSIDSQLRGNVVGYVALAGQSHAVASGLARTAADPPQLAMGPNVMVNVASVGKMFTTIAVLKSLARHHLSIDSRIWPFLPPDWVKGPGIDTITF